jgi:hypothetical protein
LLQPNFFEKCNAEDLQDFGQTLQKPHLLFDNGDEHYKNNTQAFSLSSRYTGQTLDEETGRPGSGSV